MISDPETLVLIRLRSSRYWWRDVAKQTTAALKEHIGEAFSARGDWGTELDRDLLLELLTEDFQDVSI